MEEKNKTAALRGQQIIIAKLILPRMDELGMTAYKLAKVSGVSKTTIGRWFAGTQNIKLISFLQILGALQINPHFVTKEGDDLEYVYENFN